MSPPVDESSPTHCRACGTTLVGLYCHACGQGHRHGRLRTRTLVEGFIESLVELDSRIFRTLLGLTLRPGRVVRDFIDGRRIVYVHPFKYALLAYTVSFFVMLWAAANLLDPVTSARMRSIMLPGWARFINFASLPVLAVVLQGLYRRQALRWIEHYVLVMYAMGHAVLLQMILVVVLFMVKPALAVATAPLVLVWLAWTTRVALGTGWPSTLLRSLVAISVVQALTTGVVYLLAPDIFDNVPT